jgi:hypothetical protein
MVVVYYEAFRNDFRRPVVDGLVGHKGLRYRYEHREQDKQAQNC